MSVGVSIFRYVLLSCCISGVDRQTTLISNFSAPNAASRKWHCSLSSDSLNRTALCRFLNRTGIALDFVRATEENYERLSRFIGKMLKARDLKRILQSKRKLKRSRVRKKKANNINVILTRVERCIDSFGYDHALHWCRKALELEPDNEAVLEKSASVMLETHQTDDAFKCLERAVKLYPDTGSHVKYLLLGQLSSGADAVTYISKGIDIMERGHVNMSDISTAYCSLAELYLTDQCYIDRADELCLEYCQKALKYDDKNPEAYQIFASYQLSKDNNTEAKSLLSKGVQLWLPPVDEQEEGGDSTRAIDKESSVPSYSSRINCAKLLLEVEEYETAYRVLESLLRDDDEVLTVWYLMGWLEFLRKDWKAAEMHLTKVVNMYEELDCDEEDMLTHCQEILEDIKTRHDNLQPSELQE